MQPSVSKHIPTQGPLKTSNQRSPSTSNNTHPSGLQDTLKYADIPAVHTQSVKTYIQQPLKTPTPFSQTEDLSEADFDAISLLHADSAQGRYLDCFHNPHLDASLRLKAYLKVQHLGIGLKEASQHFEPLGDIALRALKEADILSSSDLTQVYEPYWRYSEAKLKHYAQRILKQISPYIIQSQDLNQQDRTLSWKGETIAVRKVNEFGRVLPLLHLKAALEHTQASHLGAPRVFLFPKDPNALSFSFGLPYHEEESGTFYCNAGNNPLSIESDSFEIYQEYIEGEGHPGDTHFLYYGHCDLNRKQIILSDKDSKSYLIDTKDSKNFFIPAITPFVDNAYTYWHYKIGRYLPEDAKQFETWQRKQRKIIILEKCFNYGLHQDKVVIHLDPSTAIDLEGLPLQANTSIFNDKTESIPYFSSPALNAARYITLNKFDLLKSLLDKSPELDLKSVSLPTPLGWLPINVPRLCQDLKPTHPELSELIQRQSLI